MKSFFSNFLDVVGLEKMLAGLICYFKRHILRFQKIKGIRFSVLRNYEVPFRVRKLEFLVTIKSEFQRRLMPSEYKSYSTEINYWELLISEPYS